MAVYRGEVPWPDEPECGICSIEAISVYLIRQLRAPQKWADDDQPALAEAWARDLEADLRSIRGQAREDA